jgi:hypothetical protein
MKFIRKEYGAVKEKQNMEFTVFTDLTIGSEEKTGITFVNK